MARRAREREEDERQTAEMVKAWRAKNKEIDDEAEADEKRRHDELMDLKKTQYEQREQCRARVRQERADRLSGDTGRRTGFSRKIWSSARSSKRDRQGESGGPAVVHVQKAEGGEGAGSISLPGVGRKA